MKMSVLFPKSLSIHSSHYQEKYKRLKEKMNKLRKIKNRQRKMSLYKGAALNVYIFKMQWNFFLRQCYFTKFSTD